jgi:hypothetical protein
VAGIVRLVDFRQYPAVRSPAPQPVDSRLRNGMNVRVEVGGETGRVVPC